MEPPTPSRHHPTAPGPLRTGRHVAAGIPMAGAQGRAPSSAGTMVVLTLVGGLDGLSVVVPHGEPAYARRRPTTAVAPPGDRHGAIDLGRGLGLHPSLAPLHDTLGRSDQLAVIGGVGVPDHHAGSRRHVVSREFLDRGGPGSGDGWAARMLRFEGLGAESAWSFGPLPHPVFAGLADAAAAPGPVIDVGRRREPATGTAGAGAATTVLEHSGSVATEAAEPAVAAVGSSRWSGVMWTSPGRRAELGYPPCGLARSLAATADMIRADRGLRIVAIDHDGYDTHVDQGDGRDGQLAARLDQLARGLGAFWDHLGEHRSRVAVVVVSEFGRTLDENRSSGTDHGRGGVALVIGDDVVGGIHGDLPDLDSSNGAWPVSIDVRRVLADVAWSRGFQPWRGEVFGDLALPDRSLGLLLSA